MNMFIVTAVDYDKTYDGKARVLGIYKTKKEAQAVVQNDMEYWADLRDGMPIIIDFDKMSAKYNWETLDNTDGCEWNIEEIEIKS